MLSIVATGVVTFMDQLPPTLVFDNPDPLSRKPFGNIVLVKPYPHAAPYLIGILTGLLLHIKPAFKINMKTSLLGWSLSSLIIMVSLFITWQWNQGYPPGPLFGALYAALFRSLWTAAVAWIVIACHYGWGGFVNSILCWTPFIPMSRVTYTAYLIHPGLMYVFVSSTRNLFMFSHYLVIHLFFSYLLTTFLASFILTLVIEVPFIRLERLAYRYFILKQRTDGQDDCKSSVDDILSPFSRSCGRSTYRVGAMDRVMDSLFRHNQMLSNDLNVTPKNDLARHDINRNVSERTEGHRLPVFSRQLASESKVNEMVNLSGRLKRVNREPSLNRVIDANSDAFEVIRL